MNQSFIKALKLGILHFIHIPQCPFRPSLHVSAICMSKPAESLKGNQPQRQSLHAECFSEAAEASSALGERESESLYRSPLGREKSSYSNSVENASTHRGTVTHSWDNKHHRETHNPPANWNQHMHFLPNPPLPQSYLIPKSQWISSTLP